MLTNAQQMLSMIKRLHVNLRQQIHLSLCDKGKKATGVGSVAFAPTNNKNKAMSMAWEQHGKCILSFQMINLINI